MDETIKMLYTRYGKMNLNINEMSEVIGVSSSKVSKMFHEYGEEKIKQEQLLPPWNRIGSSRLWAIHKILIWNNHTEVVSTRVNL